METYQQEHELTVFGFSVTTFPEGIGEAFDQLVPLLPPTDTRPYYGLSWCTAAGIVYVAAANLAPEEQPAQRQLQTYQIEKGTYLVETLLDWQTKTHLVKNIFHTLMEDPRCDPTKPCVELYLNDQEMRCLIKMKDTPVNRLVAAAGPTFTATAQELHRLFSDFKPEEINLVPTTNSWTAGQVAEHLIISNMGFVEIITGPVTATDREPDALIARIKADFLNFSLKMESPDFVYPPNRVYQQAELLQSFQEVQDLINQAIATLDLTKTCLTFEVPEYGYLTRLEAVYFVIYHTQRHLQQLVKIPQHLVKQAA